MTNLLAMILWLHTLAINIFHFNISSTIYQFSSVFNVFFCIASFGHMAILKQNKLLLLHAEFNWSSKRHRHSYPMCINMYILLTFNWFNAYSKGSHLVLMNWFRISVNSGTISLNVAMRETYKQTRRRYKLQTILLVLLFVAEINP